MRKNNVAERKSNSRINNNDSKLSSDSISSNEKCANN